MNRILSWFLIAQIFAMSGPLQAASMASAPGFRKPLYGRFAPWADKYAYCSGDPISKSDPSGLQGEPDPNTDPSGYAKYQLGKAAHDAENWIYTEGDQFSRSVDSHWKEIVLILATEGASRWLSGVKYGKPALEGWAKTARYVVKNPGIARRSLQAADFGVEIGRIGARDDRDNGNRFKSQRGSYPWWSGTHDDSV